MAEDHIPQGVSPAIFVFGKLFVANEKIRKDMEVLAGKLDAML